ncbi:MAG: penicillin acylase family protein [Bacteroidales bacterium]|nr:penicillin acylase family protein [Bacteroidales bacterium]
MKILKRVLQILLVLILLVVVFGFFLIRNISHRAVPDYNEDVQITGLTDPVEVLRDEYGNPHVYANSEDDLYRVVGYLAAQDRLWQMDLLRRVTQGRLSEILGADMIEADQVLRALRIPEKSEMLLGKTDPEIMRCVEAYCDGVNQFIEANQKKLPFEFAVLGYKPDKWEPEHTLNLLGYMAWNLSMSWAIEPVLFKIQGLVDEDKFKELFPDLALQAPIFPGFTEEMGEALDNELLSATEKLKDLGLEFFSGSNNWAISGERSESGFPIVANDMHLGLDMAPGIWYQMHQHVPGKVHVTGVVLPGAPFIIGGHNDSIAWGMTNVMLDDIDYYLETINPEDSNQYKFNGEWKSMKVVEETISIKGGETVTKFNRFNHRGPIVSGFKDIPDKVISMHWIGNEYSNELRTVYLLNRAQNWDDFKNGANSFASISQNIVYGDVAGNIGLYCCAGVPIREGNRSLLAPGDTDQYDWKGLVPFDKLPHQFNPPEGVVVSANNRTTDLEYPYQISEWYDLPNRFHRIQELLSKNKLMGVGDMKAIQTDQQSKWSEKILKRILPMLGSATLNDQEKKALDVLVGWDFKYNPENPAPAIFEAFYYELVRSVFVDELGGELYKQFMNQDILSSYAIDRIAEGQDISWCDDVTTTDKVETVEDMVLASFVSAVYDLEEKQGTDIDSWEWGNMHQIIFNHALGSVNILKLVFGLDRGPFIPGGSYHTVCPFSYSFNDPYKANHGASQRHIFTTWDWDQSWTVIPTGVSGIPASDFYCNQSELYINKGYHPDYFSRAKVEEYAKFKAVYSAK